MTPMADALTLDHLRALADAGTVDTVLVAMTDM